MSTAETPCARSRTRRVPKTKQRSRGNLQAARALPAKHTGSATGVAVVPLEFDDAAARTVKTGSRREDALTAIARKLGGRNLWDRRKTEPWLWYTRFLIYRDLGPSRTLIRAAREEYRLNGKTVPDQVNLAPWAKVQTEHDWDPRAQAWDVEQYHRRKTMEELERQEWRDTRKRIMQDALDKLSKRLPEVDVAKIGPKQFFDALLKTVEVLRTEMEGDQPKKLELTGAGGAPLSLAHSRAQEMDLEGLNDDELGQLQGLLARALGAGG